ncbi:hypothetical protein EJB05_36003 [Eragrostis curvula]|uniref:Uncharacterized protein n=1 Tax=Eragrostis curvula TaxID=38414 RepID=A0A5J9U972_9POAL|nr:hypothetical protein EJB05_36003 [Eragrostis curvula]
MGVGLQSQEVGRAPSAAGTQQSRAKGSATATPCQPALGTPAATTDVFQEHEVKPVVSGTQGGGPAISNQQQQGASLAVAAPMPEEMLDDCSDDIAMYIDFDAVAHMMPCYPGVKMEDYQFDGLDADTVGSPLWALDD